MAVVVVKVGVGRAVREVDAPRGICVQSMKLWELVVWRIGSAVGEYWKVSRGVSGLCSFLSRFCRVTDSPDEVLVRREGGCMALRMELPGPVMGRSLRCWKFRGLRPRTMMGQDVVSQMETLRPVSRVAITLSRITKCCCSSFRRPLLAVAIRN